MATPSTAFGSLRTEVEQRICSLTPNRQVKARAIFSVYEPVKSKPINEWTGKSRTFAVGDFTKVEHWHSGYSEQGILYSAPIVIVYARGPVWNLAAIDDCHQIYHHILVNPYNSNGVSNRFISNSPPTVSNHPDQPWDYYTIMLQAYLSVTAT